jgi:heme oxygenase
LGYLGCSEAVIETLPRCEALPEMATIGAALGSMYVWEGSTLGGQMICRHLHQLLGVTPLTGARYFSSYGDGVGRRWQEFRQILLDFSSPQNDPLIVAGAIATFESLQTWFSATLSMPYAETR